MLLHLYVCSQGGVCIRGDEHPGGSASRGGLHPDGSASKGGLHPRGICIQGGLHPGAGGLYPGGLHSRGAGQTPQILHPWGLGRSLQGYCGIQSTSGRYASYWNAFLLSRQFGLTDIFD